MPTRSLQRATAGRCYPPPPPAPLPGSVLSLALQELSLALTDDLCFKALYHEILRLSLTDITAEVRPRSSCTV